MQSFDQLDFLAVLEQYTQQEAFEFSLQADGIAVRNWDLVDTSSRESHTCLQHMDNLGMLAETYLNKAGGSEST